MGRLQQHRGPDGEGHFIDDVIALGMRRLSIIDVAHGNQPFFNKDRSVAVVCNGEIYNYRELREDLRKSGVVFHTGSDVEVIPHLYDRYGMEFVHKLNGMYAIALYDSTRRILYLVRDRLGIKPLYYTVHRNELVFSSELKAILAVVGGQPKPDLNAFSTYLELLYIPAPMTPFQDIRKLEPASYLAWEDNRATKVRYWDPDLAIDDGRSERAWMDDINALLLDSTDLELRSDVPVGSFLSGGVDSSLVTALAARATAQPFSTFHMRWKDVEGKIDESVYARMVSERYGTRETMRDVSQIDLIGLLPKLVWHLEEPFADAAFVPTYLLANIAAEKVKVILSGAGGDELFGGYAHHKRHSLAKSLITGLLHGRYPAFNYYDM
jgi:asparagine synthase (glutamine-hydrolysing)